MYRILTENVNTEQVRKILDEKFEAYTLLPAEGVWRGKREQSLVVEVDCNECGPVVRGAALAIKQANQQEAVLVQQMNVTSELV